MADYCWEATEAAFGPEFANANDMRGLCARGDMAFVLCEGCDTEDGLGFHYVDNLGHCLGFCHDHPETTERLALLADMERLDRGG